MPARSMTRADSSISSRGYIVSCMTPTRNGGGIPPIFSDASAAGRVSKRDARLGESVEPESADALGEETLGESSHIVEAEDTWFWHAVLLAEGDFRRNPPDGPRGRYDDEPFQDRDCHLAREDEKRAASRLRMLRPPHLTSRHQGSARMDSRAASSAQGSGSCGMRRYPWTIAASIAASRSDATSRSIAARISSERDRPVRAARSSSSASSSSLSCTKVCRRAMTIS